MNSRWFNVAVVLLWLASMTWLVTAKILPSFAVGSPPDHHDMFCAEGQVLGYQVRWSDEPVGWAVVHGKRLVQGGSQIDSRLHFNRLPLRQIIPEGILDLFALKDAIPGEIRLDGRHEVTFHSSGRLQRFHSIVTLAPNVSTIQVEGFVAGDAIMLTIRSAGATYHTQRPLPENIMVSNGLMPQPQMPGLWKGRKWTVEMYSPLLPRTNPVQILQAEVVGRDHITWSGQLENAWLVVYRGDPGDGVGREGKERVWLWVRDDGMVLKHKIALLDGTLAFVRLPPGQESELDRIVQRQASNDCDCVELETDSETP